MIVTLATSVVNFFEMIDLPESDVLMALPQEDFDRLVAPWFFSTFCPKHEWVESKVGEGIQFNPHIYGTEAAQDIGTILQDHLGIPQIHARSARFVEAFEKKSAEWVQLEYIHVGDPFYQTGASERNELERRIKDQCRQVLDCVAEIRFLLTPPQGGERISLPEEIEGAVDDLSKSATSLILSDSLLGQSGYMNTARQTPRIEEGSGTLKVWAKEKLDVSTEAFFKSVGAAMGVGAATAVTAGFASLVLKSDKLLELIALLWK
ncbi:MULTISPECIES: hypothetical protein [Pacificibacter]|uniref:hypothetical protein n=1 Tax=Pacificibacter TaxID=1042323 RepID=UPI001C09B081|nr:MULTISPECIES: hypothetical protein [Pacificibacter]MBU2934464.1 hypothetical protein [Pacificibacter marinus]MDO6617394.1 hypothetical protein [Pacificibacter sp. 1_MG-2023]